MNSVQTMAFLPSRPLSLWVPQSHHLQHTGIPRMSSFRWPRKAKLIFLESCSENVIHFSSTAPVAPGLKSRPPHSSSQASANSSNLISRFSTSTFCSSEASCLPASQPNRALVLPSRSFARASAPPTWPGVPSLPVAVPIPQSLPGPLPLSFQGFTLVP